MQNSHTLFLAAWIAPNVTSITVNRETHPNGRGLLTEDDYPDIELLLGASSLTGDVSGSYRSLLGLTPDFRKEIVNVYDGFDAFSLVPVLLRPKSRGRLTLRSTDPLDSPTIDLNYYDDEDDLNTMVQALKIVRVSILIYNQHYTQDIFFCVLNLLLIILFVD